MSYLDKVLQPGESVRHHARIHWIVYVPGLIVLVLAGVAYLFGDRLVPAPWPMWVAGVIVILALHLLIGAWLRRWTTELVITDRRVIFKQGFIRRRSIEMNMDKIESVDVDQSILGRMLNYGDITVRGTGTGLEPLRGIDDPLVFRNHVTAG